MKRLLLALPLLLHLSGLTGMAAVVCAFDSMPAHCCCHPAAAGTTVAPSLQIAPHARDCRCTVKRGPASSPATTSVVVTSDLDAASAQSPTVGRAAYAPSGPASVGHASTLDVSPPYLTSAPTRC